MKKAEKVASASIPIALLIGILIAVAGSQYGNTYNGLPVFGLVVVIAFFTQVVAFIPAFISQTEKYYDITGTMTYVLTTLIAMFLASSLDTRSFLLGSIVLIWTLRLGIFLFIRINKAGKDIRFDNLKPSFIRFLNAWVLQGLWVTFTAGATLTAISSNNLVAFGSIGLIGLIIWITGFTIEVKADNQKSKFNADLSNKNKFINTGLWSRSRHPNYFGEILLWFGIAVIAFPVLKGSQLFTLVSPLFVYILLTRGSGVPLLEKKADKTWGGDPDYEEYKDSTPILFPKLFS
jgi:steroid 5-alpha reductase family enzyme